MRAAGLVYLFGLLEGLGAVWLTVPAFVGYLVVHKVKRGHWRSPFDWIDVLTYLLMGYALMVSWQIFPNEHCAKGMSNLADELIALGAGFSILLCARIPFVWKHPEWRLRFSILTAVLMAVISVCVGALVPPIEGC